MVPSNSSGSETRLSDEESDASDLLSSHEGSRTQPLPFHTDFYGVFRKLDSGAKRANAFGAGYSWHVLEAHADFWKTLSKGKKAILHAAARRFPWMPWVV
jgi:hypothetical protein